MNRQAVPSILLSVAIVCFFAVALYPRDDPARRASRESSAGPKAEAPASPPSPVAAREARPAEPAARPIRTASKPAERPGSPRPSSLATTAQPRKGNRARGSFTVVAAGESIADVSRRVYGTADRSEAIWRANRDVVPEPGARPEPGTVLHTPDAPLR